MRILRGLFRLALGLALGAALGYAVASWLLEQERLRAGLEPGDATPSPARLVESLQERVRQAVDEGRRAASEARAELRAEAYGVPSRAEEAGDAHI